MRPVTGIVITQNKQVEERQLCGLADYQSAVGGLIESVTLKDGSTMYVNEEGRLIPSLRFNSIATDVAGVGGRPDLLFVGLKGDVVVVGPLDAEGNDTDVTSWARRLIDRVASEAR